MTMPTTHRTPAFPISELPGSLPTLPIPEDIDHVKIATQCLNCLASGDLTIILEGGYWRDLLALTSTLCTFYSASRITTGWNDITHQDPPSNFSLIEGRSEVVKAGPVQWIQARFRFENGLEPKGKCLGIMRIVPTDDGGWKIWCLSTVLKGVEGWGDPDVFPEDLLEHQETNGIRDCEGNGVNGTGTLGVDAVAAERFEEVGMNWTERYQSLKLHTPKLLNSLPFNFIPPKDTPYYMSMQDLGKYYKSFVKKYQLEENLWLSTTIESATWNDMTRSWKVGLKRHGEHVEIEARHILFCTGMTGRVPKMPEYANQELFKGNVLHAVDYRSSSQWAGKKGIVIGTANTAHDVAEDMMNAGISVTMIQRERTNFYREGVDVTDVDMDFETSPIAIDRLIMKNLLAMAAKQDAAKFDALERAGFRVNREADLMHIIFERAGGHYLDVSVSKLIGDGKIKVKSGSAPVSYAANGLKFDDGTELEADIIVFATGYEGNMRLTASKIVEPKIAEKLDDCWQLDKEGEPRGAWKPIGRKVDQSEDPNVWYCPGDIALTRYHSRFLALQIKAEVEGNPFIPYERVLSDELPMECC
ncbi:FAD/NAD(P)-binding domain-containing protein [Zopfia rhizophila CBS 207.26]|uniref:FAD/NAD(P)-binding domain-containing protein n=1 Tax=Zopfia rhizophila CBS 207.26 TaxID=1314779 RepID=A0A6A6E5Z2_9PEZI|nr:FAD/NAD(P)-binding domain-containing protein [Zopfia rhizophila CBS 207.26]